MLIAELQPVLKEKQRNEFRNFKIDIEGITMAIYQLNMPWMKKVKNKWLVAPKVFLKVLLNENWVATLLIVKATSLL